MSDHRKPWLRRQDPPTAEQVEAWANAKVKTTEAETRAQRVSRAAEREDRREERAERRAEKKRERDHRRQLRKERAETVQEWAHKTGTRIILVVPILLVNVMALAGQVGFAAEHLDWQFPMTWVFAGALESIAVYIGWHAHVALLAGHSVVKLRAASYGAAAVVAAMNFEHFTHPTTHEPTASSFAFGMMSLLSPWLWAMHSRYVHRAQLEADGMVDKRAARFGAAKWLHFPGRTLGALRWSIDHGVADPSAAWSGYTADRTAKRAAKKALKDAGKKGPLTVTAHADTDPDATAVDGIPVPLLSELSAPLSARNAAPADDADPADNGADMSAPAPADNPADGPADNRRLTLAAPPAPAPPSAPTTPATPAPRMSGADIAEPQVSESPRPAVSAPAASANTQPTGTPAAPSAPSASKADKGAARRTDKPSVSAAVTQLMRQGITDADEITARIPDIVGRDVPRATVARTLRRHRAAVSSDSHAGNYL